MLVVLTVLVVVVVVVVMVVLVYVLIVVNPRLDDVPLPSVALLPHWVMDIEIRLMMTMALVDRVQFYWKQYRKQ